MVEGKKTNGSSSLVCSGNWQSKELPRKENSGMERIAKDTEACVESAHIPFMEILSNFPKVRFGGIQDGKKAENQKIFPGQELKLPDSTQHKMDVTNSGVNLVVKGDISLIGKSDAVKVGGKGKNKSRGGLNNSITVQKGGMGGSSGITGQARMSYRPKQNAEVGMATHTFPEGSNTRGQTQATLGSQQVSIEASTRQVLDYLKESSQKLPCKRKNNETREDNDWNSLSVIPLV